MISTVDLYKEIEKYEDLIAQPKVSDDDYRKAMIKIGILNAKLLHNIRTNMVKTMEKFGIEKVKPKVKEDTTK